MDVNEQIFDDTIRHQIQLQGLNNRTVKQMLALLGKVEKRVIAELANADITDVRRSRLSSLLATVEGIISDGYKQITGELESGMRDLGEYEAGWQVTALKRSIPVALNVAKPSANQIWAAVTQRPFSGRLMSEWFKDLETGAFNRMKQAIRLGYVEGRTAEQILKDIRGSRALGYKDGVIDRNRRGLKTAVRTALGHTAAAARMRTIEENEAVVKGVIWTSTLDTRTSPICRVRDGLKYDLDHKPVGHSNRWLGGPSQAHPNCRSIGIPWIKSWKELGINLKEAPEGTRASMSGQVPASKNYETWLRDQIPEVQDDVLGAAKGKLFRLGKLPMERFVDVAGREYTLAELKQREPEIWAKVFAHRTATKPKPPLPAPPKTAPAPKPAPAKFVPLKNIEEAENWAIRNVTSRAGFSKSAKIAGVNIFLEEILNMQRRFSLPPLRFLGDRARDSFRWRRSNSYASFVTRGSESGGGNGYFFGPKGANPKSYISNGRRGLYLESGPDSYSISENQKWRRQTGVDPSVYKYHALDPKVEELAKKMHSDPKARWDWTVDGLDGDDVRLTAIHENGHRFHRAYMTELDKIMADNNIQRGGWGYLISKYSLTNNFEYIAESFTLYVAGDTSQFYRIHPAILKFFQSKDGTL